MFSSFFVVTIVVFVVAVFVFIDVGAAVVLVVVAASAAAAAACVIVADIAVAVEVAVAFTRKSLFSVYAATHTGFVSFGRWLRRASPAPSSSRLDARSQDLSVLRPK